MSEIVYVVDKQYFELFKVSVGSLIDKTTIPLKINILTRKYEFSETDKKKIKQYYESLRSNIVINFSISEMFENWENNKIIPDAKLWYSHNVYLKLCMHDAFPELDWITYIDCDTLIYKNIDNFLLEKDYPFPIAAPIDLNYNLDFDYAYFCTAVFKTSLKYWRENNLDKLFVKGISENWEFVDQDILNRCFKHNRTIIPLKYSTQHIYENSFHYMTWLYYAKIIHFGGPFKPTNPEYTSESDWFLKWKKYESKYKSLTI